MALARKYRLNKKDLKRVFKQGKTVINSFFFIRFLKNELGHARIAAIIPSKVSKKAVVRNGLKRIIIESVRTGHFLEESYDLAITATLNIVEKPSKEIKEHLEQATNKIFSQ